jgi:hypothetical protein
MHLTLARIIFCVPNQFVACRRDSIELRRGALRSGRHAADVGWRKAALLGGYANEGSKKEKKKRIEPRTSGVGENKTSEAVRWQ